MKESKSIFILFLLFLSGSCSKAPSEFSSAEEYSAWVADEQNQLRQVKLVNDLEFGAQFKTIDYILYHENRFEDGAPEAKEFAQELTGGIYFTFRIFNKEGTDPLKFKIHHDDEFYDRIKYYSFDAQKDFCLVNGSDTMNCLNYHFERNYGIAPELTMLLAFDTIVNNQDKEFVLIYNDRVFGNGPLKFRFDEENIKSIPTLNIAKR